MEKNIFKRNRIGLKHKIERIGILGGVSGGGALIIIDAILRNSNQIAVGIFDNDSSNHGQEVLGVPIVGNIESLLKAVENGKIDSVVIAFNRNLEERSLVFNDLKEKGVLFTNVIDPSVEIRTGVEIGEGNVILAKTYIAACTKIGDNNFISSNICIEHGNIIGSHNAFGPGVFTSGNVIVKDRIRFGTGVFVEPNISIGQGVTLGSFVLIDRDIEDNVVLKRKQDFFIKNK